MERIKRHLSYANVAATLALVIAMSGGALAATGGFTSGGKLQACTSSNGTLKLLQPGKKCKKGQKALAWNQTGPAGPKGATGATGIAGLNGSAVPKAAEATTATTALTANNALALGGTPASGFTHSDCSSETGQVKGFATIPAEPGLTFTKLTLAYNCSGQAVEAERITKGGYIVRFVGNPAAIAIGTSDAGSTVVNTHELAPGEWRIESWDSEQSEEHVAQFSLLVP
jgi:hypothetical protein